MQIAVLEDAQFAAGVEDHIAHSKQTAEQALVSVVEEWTEGTEALLEEARSQPSCAIEPRAELYQQAADILQADLPAAWLFWYEAMHAAADDVQGFAPHPFAPMAGLSDWVINR